MIAVERGPVPASLSGFDSPGERERRDAIAFFSEQANQQASFGFDAYTADDVKEALKAMFGSKCAYCEADVLAVGPTDTEHYRPKAEVAINGQGHKPAYYWLAADWENLLPTCPYCNRPCWQDTTSGRRKTGKGIEFPLADETMRAQAHGEEEFEQPLLLDPCREDPELHLEFTADGVVRAVEDENGVPSPRGEKTIEVLGLDRINLCAARDMQAIVIERAIVHYKKAAAQFGRDPGNAELESEVEDEMGELERLMDPETVFSALARQMVAREVPEIGP